MEKIMFLDVKLFLVLQLFAAATSQTQIKTGKWKVHLSEFAVSRSSRLSCISHCEQQSAVNAAIVDASGRCSCDDFRNDRRRTYIYRTGRNLENRSLIYIPFLSFTQYNSSGTESLQLSVGGTQYNSSETESLQLMIDGTEYNSSGRSIGGQQMDFEADGPASYLKNGKKTMRLYLPTPEHFIKYQLTEQTMHRMQTEGVVLTFWLKVRHLSADMQFMKFLGKFWLSQARIYYASAGNDNTPLSFSVDGEWHFYTIAFNPDSRNVVFMKDTPENHLKQTYSHMGFSTNPYLELSAGEQFCDIDFYCLVVQPLVEIDGPKAIAMAQEARVACDFI